MQPSSPETRKRNYSQMTTAELAAENDALEARIDDAEAKIDAALAPEPMDWNAHYADILASIAAVAARLEGGA